MERYTTEEVIKEAIQWYKDFCQMDFVELHSLRDFKNRYIIGTLTDIWDDNYNDFDLLDNYLREYFNGTGVLEKELQIALKKVSLKDFNNGKDFNNYEVRKYLSLE